MPKKLKKHNRKIPRITVLLLMILGFISIYLYNYEKAEIEITEEITPEIDPSSLASSEQIYHFANDFGILSRLVRITNRNDFIEVALPVDENAVDLNYTNLKLTQFLTKLNWTQISGTEATNAQILTFNAPDNISYRFRLSYADRNVYPAIKPKIAIIVKGFGAFSQSELDRWLTQNNNICYAVIPINRISRNNHQRFLNSNFETLIEIPMEDTGHPFIPTPDYAIFGHMKDREVRKKLDHYYSLLQGAKGTITHRGGLITTDRRIMPIILTYIKQKNMYFVCDKAIETSIAFNLAQHMMLDSFEKTHTFIPSHYINDTNNTRLENDIKNLEKNPVIITLQRPDNETFEFVRKLIQAVNKTGHELVRISSL